jgi:hypothetical protein
MIRSVLAGFLFLFVAVSGASAQNCAPPATLVNGTNADATQVNTNFSNVFGCVRDKLTAARTYYVRIDGNDSNTGLVDSPAGAFLTVAKAMTVAGGVDCAAQQLIIQIDAGTWTPAISLARVLGSVTPILQGVGSTTTISTTNVDAITNDAAGLWQINNLKILTTTSGDGLVAKNGGAIKFFGVEFGANAGIQINAQPGSSIAATGNYTVSGSAVYHVAAQGYVNTNGVTVTLSGTPAFSVAFAAGLFGGYYEARSVTYTGSATGSRYQAAGNGVIYTVSGGANYFPGSSAGVSSQGGQYF